MVNVVATDNKLLTLAEIVAVFGRAVKTSAFKPFILGASDIDQWHASLLAVQARIERLERALVDIANNYETSMRQAYVDDCRGWGREPTDEDFGQFLLTEDPEGYAAWDVARTALAYKEG